MQTPIKIHPQITLVHCRISKDGKFFIPQYTPRPQQSSSKVEWSAQEDDLLRSLAKSKKWSRYAQQLNFTFHEGVSIRTAKHCRERWNNYLNPNLRKESIWSAEELKQLAKLYIKTRSWAKIASEIGTRNENQVRNQANVMGFKRKMKTADVIKAFNCYVLSPKYRTKEAKESLVISEESLMEPLELVKKEVSFGIKSPMQVCSTPLSSPAIDRPMYSPRLWFKQRISQMSHSIPPLNSHNYLSVDPYLTSLPMLISFDSGKEDLTFEFPKAGLRISEFSNLSDKGIHSPISPEFSFTDFN